MSPRRALLAAAALLTAGLACGGGPVGPQGRDGLRVLFVGNSLTYWNDMPAMVAALADSAGAEPLAWGAIARPDFGLPDHWDRGDAAEAIREGEWDVVVLQQGPSALAESRAILLDYAGRFADLAREEGARPALYMVWPSRARSGDFDRVVESYTLAAEAVDGLLLPAGEAWRAAWAEAPDLELYGADGFHPSVAGSYLVALVAYAVLYDAVPTGLPAELSIHGEQGSRVVGVTPEIAAVLQRAAARVTGASGVD